MANVHKTINDFIEPAKYLVHEKEYRLTKSEITNAFLTAYRAEIEYNEYQIKCHLDGSYGRIIDRAQIKRHEDDIKAIKLLLQTWDS